MNKEFIVKIKMDERWVDTFCSFLKRMECNGNIGHSERISFYSDGDGDFRPKFEFEGITPVINMQERNDNLFDAG